MQPNDQAQPCSTTPAKEHRLQQVVRFPFVMLFHERIELFYDASEIDSNDVSFVVADEAVVSNQVAATPKFIDLGGDPRLVREVRFEKVPIVLDKNTQVLEIKIKQLGVSSNAHPLVLDFLFLARINSIVNAVWYIESVEVLAPVRLNGNFLNEQPQVVLYCI